jgi:hypothetical protein
MKKKERKKESQKPEERKQTSLFKRETLSLPEEATELEVESKCCFLAINGESCVRFAGNGVGQKVVGKSSTAKCFKLASQNSNALIMINKFII